MFKAFNFKFSLIILVLGVLPSCADRYKLNLSNKPKFENKNYIIYFGETPNFKELTLGASVIDVGIKTIIGVGVAAVGAPIASASQMVNAIDTGSAENNGAVFAEDYIIKDPINNIIENLKAPFSQTLQLENSAFKPRKSKKIMSYNYVDSLKYEIDEKVDYILFANTKSWGISHNFNPKKYTIDYSALISLYDLKGDDPNRFVDCNTSTKQSYSYKQLLEDEAQIINSQIPMLAQKCVDDLIKKINI